MPIISVEILKTIDERKRSDTRCVETRWNNSEVLISVRDNENNRWNRNGKKPKKQQQKKKTNEDRKEQGGGERGEEAIDSEAVRAKWFFLDLS